MRSTRRPTVEPPQRTSGAGEQWDLVPHDGIESRVMLRSISGAALAVVVAVVCSAWRPSLPVPSVLEPASTGGIETVDRALAKLSTHRRVMVVGAHPDDEDTTVLSLVSRRMGGEAAYLSLSRGEGGQNLVGPELGVGLGLIRTGELLAARGFEGTWQYFTRAYDFGYTRSLEETFERWPREVLEEDAVRAVRRFKPQVIVTVFPGDSTAGHGQHQMAGVIAAEILDLAGDPDRFPALTAEGLGPWQPEAAYRRLWRGTGEPIFETDFGLIDPLTGKSVIQIASASRSMHRSQDMGRVQQLGSYRGGMVWIAGEGRQEATAIFDGIDTRLSAMASSLPVGDLRRSVEVELELVEGLAIKARQTLLPSDPGRTVPALAEIVRTLQGVAEALAEQPTPATVAVASLVDEKLAVATAGLTAAAGVAFDAVADREAVTLGTAFEATVELWNGGGQSLEVRAVSLQTADGWLVEPVELTDDQALESLDRWRFQVSVPAEDLATKPYFLRLPLVGDLYDWSQTPSQVRGEPFQPPPLTARLELELAGAGIRLEREVVYRYGDQAIGEVRRPLRTVPVLEVGLMPALILQPLGSPRDRYLEVLLSSNSEAPIRGRLEARLPEGWLPVDPQPFSIDQPRGMQVLELPLIADEGLEPGTHVVSVSAVLDSGDRLVSSYAVLDYPHIRPATMERPAATEVRALDLRLPSLSRVGYIRGASDRVPELLMEVGVPLELLGPSELENGDLGVYEAIVVGSRAYETDPTLLRANPRLLKYVEQGGTLIVQYQQYQFVRGGFAPLPLVIERPHGRVTDETSPVRVLEPEHPVFRNPNRISSADWEGWVQERGLYFPTEWDEAYRPLLALQDAGRPEELGSLLVASVGEGTYVYTGLSFFRELPAGVPGAFRLFMNLLALGEE